MYLSRTSEWGIARNICTIERKKYDRERESTLEYRLNLQYTRTHTQLLFGKVDRPSGKLGTVLGTMVEKTTVVGGTVALVVGSAGITVSSRALQPLSTCRLR